MRFGLRSQSILLSSRLVFTAFSDCAAPALTPAAITIADATNAAREAPAAVAAFPMDAMLAFAITSPAASTAAAFATIVIGAATA